MTGILQRKAQWEREAVEKAEKQIADWMRKVAANLVKSQSDCLLANADIIEESRYVVERGECESEVQA